jgi:hypothetical protein
LSEFSSLEFSRPKSSGEKLYVFLMLFIELHDIIVFNVVQEQMAGSFLVTFPFIYVLYICIVTQIGSSPLFSPFYLSPLLMVIIADLIILYSFLY